jgi:hypothetical protein
MRVRTRFTDEGHEAAIPRELFIEMRGPAVGMNVAIDTFGPVAAEVANVARGGQKPRFVLDHPGTIG